MTEVHLSFEEIRAGAHDLAEQRKTARESYETHSQEAAQAEHDFRKKLAIELTRFRSQEKGFGESEVLANGEAADQRMARDMAQSKAKACLLRIEEIERNQATLRQLADFSKELEGRG